MKHQNKFSQGRQQGEAAAAQGAHAGELKFHNVEDLLRHDAARTAVPPEIARRLSQSIAQSAAPRRAWWRRLIG